MGSYPLIYLFFYYNIYFIKIFSIKPVPIHTHQGVGLVPQIINAKLGRVRQGRSQ